MRAERIGLISDIHGNRAALDAVLAELEGDGVDSLVCLGDVAVGPQGAEALARVRELGCPVILGNWDAAFVDGSLPPAANETARIVNEIHGWWGEQLSADDRTFLATFAGQLDLPVDGSQALLFHGSPRSYDDWIFSTTPEEELSAMFDRERPALLVGGHTHVQLVRRWGASLLVNPGSVGLPFLTWWPERVTVAPWAEYAVVTADGGVVRVELRRTTFDVEGYLRESRASGMPHAEWWADCWVR
jgi:predicted phosphodiesterase